MSNQKYYAVTVGRVKKPSIFKTWDETNKVVKGYEGAKYKSFTSYKEALDYIKRETNISNPSFTNTNEEYMEKQQDNKLKLREYRKVRQDSKSSNGENVVETHLRLLGYDYFKEYGVLIGDYTYRFDFAVFNNGKLMGFIEFDGEQHFNPIDDFGGEKGFKSIQFRDRVKNEYCERNDIKLLRIRYSDGHKSKNLIEVNFPKEKTEKKQKRKTKKISSQSVN